ncbi:MAG: hypothetical protein IH940_05090 [Acidobacteria bacterium]|nr:hypothetical protein [Acidobacteriota bacterium]
MLYQHNVVFNQDERAARAARRYLATVSAALLNEHYLDNELRIEYLQDRISKNLEVDEAVMRDPERRLQSAKREYLAARRSGSNRGYSYAASRVGLDLLESTLASTLALHTPGDLVDIGAGRGGNAIFLTAYLEAHEIGERTVWVNDRFEADREAGRGADLNTMRDGFERFNLLDDRVRFLQGPPRDALDDPALTHVALARIGDVEAGEVAEVLDWLIPRVQIGGSVIIDSSPAVTQLARAALEETGLANEIDIDDGVTLRWTKRMDSEAREVVLPPSAVPLAAPSTSADIDLSIIVVIYNMKREAARSLHSMSRSYQLDVEDVSYEVIVVDNGSDADQRLSEADVARFGPEFRLVEMGDDAPPSPVPALIAGTECARGRAFAFMIDGAHVLTPRVIAQGLRGLAAYDPAIVMTQQWYVGPGQQNDLMLEGYDETYEDELFVQIDWPNDGYRLFDIGSFVGDRDWFDGMWESNCLFAPRALIAQVGAFDERFDVAGGGYANLDLYERLGSDPATTVVSILGEGSFHQTHGGTTTNQAEILERGRRLIDYRQSYEDLRGRTFQGPGKPIHYVGNLWYANARRTKPRRMNAPLFARARHKASTETLPIPDEVRSGFTESFWNSAGWRESTWRGKPLPRNPADLWMYQEIIFANRPDVVLEIRALVDEPGLARYLADISPLIGGPRILSLGKSMPPDEQDDAVEWLVAPDRTYESEAVASVEQAVDGASVLLILGRGRKLETTLAFDAYQHLVPQGSYAIVEDTILNGNPAEPEFGPGPREAVKTILRGNGDFIADPSMERLGLTFNPDGFLLRRTGP